VAAIISLLVLGIAIVAVLALGLGREKPKRRTSRPAPGKAAGAADAGSRPARDAGVEPRPLDPAEAGPRVRASGHGRPGVPLDLTCLEPPPDGGQLVEDPPVATEAAAEILKSAEGMSQLVGRRAVILKAMSGLSQEPRETTRLVVADPALAGQVLKTVNSAFYGLRYPVASVFRAVLLLGHLEVRNIIWRSCFSDPQASAKGPTSAAMDALWQHSFATSRVAYALAKSLGLAAPDDVSTAALLHDIGKVFCLRAKPFLGMALYGDVVFTSLERRKRELAELEASHASLGCEIVKIWGLPPESRTAIGLHHMPSYVDPSDIDGDPRGVAVVYAADILCHAAARAGAENAAYPIYLPRQAWLKLLGVEERIEELCAEGVTQALARPVHTLETPDAASAAVGSSVD
jgi:putative nucleotidyltransferase with HDIG domain